MRMEFNDVAADGVVSREALLGQVDARLASINRNGLGVITTTDLLPRHCETPAGRVRPVTPLPMQGC